MTKWKAAVLGFVVGFVLGFMLTKGSNDVRPFDMTVFVPPLFAVVGGGLGYILGSKNNTQS